MALWTVSGSFLIFVGFEALPLLALAGFSSTSESSSSSDSITARRPFFAGAASGAICAWSQGGGLTGLKPAETNKDHAEYSDDEFHKDWMMNHKTDGFWKSEFSESVDVGCEKYSVD